MELILTQAEKDALLWQDLDNESLGKLLRASLIGIQNSTQELDRTLSLSASLLLCVNHPTGTRLSLRGVTNAGELLGNYVVTVEKDPDE